ncbi:hypothetical protein GCM10017674_81330 [Streptomyces gardneri]|uniref:Uncharacterized protein n=1 Tax=Streptomyces gardneri TaxID=66892 RepID=A0A4Y3R9M3_9ACTN|nr:hypothetical protein SGA01_00110 [Streptomyces gardneri]GHH24140.1 hypothetical protein GCM10017674_81330 [Streptomyces gardneri]
MDAGELGPAFLGSDIQTLAQVVLHGLAWIPGHGSSAVRRDHQWFHRHTWTDLLVPVSLDAVQGPWTCLTAGYASRNSSARGTNTSWYWKIPPCPAPG